MLFFLCIFFGVQQILVSHATHQECGKFNETQFYNQEEYLSPGEYPWVGRVGYLYMNRIELRCLAVLISERHAIVPAHCVQHQDPLTMIFKNSRGYDWSYNIVELAVHPDSTNNNRQEQNDIAIATLDKDVEFSDYAQPICLPPTGESGDDYVSQRMDVATLYRQMPNEESSYDPDRFIKIQAQITSLEHCKAKYAERRFPATSKQICGYLNAKGRVMSGSPLMGVNVIDGKPKNLYLIGFISFGVSFQTTKFPDVFTRIQPYKEWIQRNSS